jgi:hypothetical protein
MDNPNRDALVEAAVRRLRRRVCIFIGIAGLLFAVFVIQTQVTWVGVVSGIVAVAAAGAAVASLVAKQKRAEVERTWLAIGLAAVSVVVVVVGNLL